MTINPMAPIQTTFFDRGYGQMTFRLQLHFTAAASEIELWRTIEHPLLDEPLVDCQSIFVPITATRSQWGAAMDGWIKEVLTLLRPFQ